MLIRGAKEHNLKGFDLTLPRNRLIVITGLSGSGKSSLAFDTLYAEGQRRYVESLSAYARQFLDQLQKPNVEHIEGLPPAIAIEQRTAGSNPRSTVATTTEIYDYLRLIFARIGIPHCFRCGTKITRQSSSEIVQRVMGLTEGAKVFILAPLVRGRKGEYQKLFEAMQKEGFVRVRVDGEFLRLEEPIRLNKKLTHTIEVVVDRVTIDAKQKGRIADSVETALKVGKGLVVVGREKEGDLLFSEQYGCPRCGTSFEELEPRMFSFNSPYGACPTCHGLGSKLEVDPELVIKDKNLSLREGAIEPWRRGGKALVLHYRRLLRSLSYEKGFDLETPFRDLPRDIQRLIFYGGGEEGSFEGVIPNLERRFIQTESDYMREMIQKVMDFSPCPACQGSRLRPEALAVTIGGKTIREVTQLSIREAAHFFNLLRLSEKEKLIAHEILKEIQKRLQFLANVGLDYMTLDRESGTLAGGESQRVRLATQIGSGLVGVLYILDEPSIGLHQRDNRKLLVTLKALRDLGNTVIVVEHDEATIRSADYIVDLGPGAGRHGGEIVAKGTLPEVLGVTDSLTARYLRGELSIGIPLRRRSVNAKKALVVRGCREHNLKNIDVTIPLGLFTCVTGVSGSGKSTLVNDILYRALARKLYRSREHAGVHRDIVGIEHLDKVIIIDQSPIGRTPRSNPATYTGLFTTLRDLFSRLPEARMKGYRPGRFSFNVKGGRCEACEGDGIKRIEMQFLPDVYVPCEICRGLRYNEQTLEIRYRGRSIADVLSMTVEEALNLFEHIPHALDKLKTLYEVGLGYIQLGQSATTLSGGEAQRVKLATELSKRSTGRTLYILDEPTTGLHLADIEKLLNVLQALVAAGNTVLVIEHHLDVIKTADYLIDLGPGGGEEGGQIVACGMPEKVAQSEHSFTGEFLRKILKGSL
ncbi:MAG: excinuclease ABC subunit UvrA [Candidatus Omnitrophota bacterium]